MAIAAAITHMARTHSAIEQIDECLQEAYAQLIHVSLSAWAPARVRALLFGRVRKIALDQLGQANALVPLAIPMASVEDRRDERWGDLGSSSAGAPVAPGSMSAQLAGFNFCSFLTDSIVTPQSVRDLRSRGITESRFTIVTPAPRLCMAHDGLAWNVGQ